MAPGKVQNDAFAIYSNLQDSRKPRYWRLNDANPEDVEDLGRSIPPVPEFRRDCFLPY
jgi:hypothetical protein